MEIPVIAEQMLIKQTAVEVTANEEIATGKMKDAIATEETATEEMTDGIMNADVNVKKTLFRLRGSEQVIAETILAGVKNAK